MPDVSDLGPASARDIADVPALEIVSTAALHLMSAAAVNLGLAEDLPEHQDLDEARTLIEALAGLVTAGAPRLGHLVVDHVETTGDAVEHVVVGLVAERVRGVEEAGDVGAPGAHQRPLVAHQGEPLHRREDALEIAEQTEVRRRRPHATKAVG